MDGSFTKLGTILVILAGVWITEGSKILALFPYQGRSHNIMFEPIVIGLARAGHSVDVVSHFPPKEPVEGLNHISLKGTLHFYVDNMTASFARTLMGVKAIDFISYQEPNDLCNLMRLPQLQNVINTDKKYDLMLTEVFGTNCYLAVAHKLKLPVVGVVTSAMYPWAYDTVAESPLASFIPCQFTPYTNDMRFMERLENLVIILYSKFLFFYYDKTVSEPIAKKYIDDLTSLNDIYFNFSLVLVNSHRSIHGVRSTSPAIVDVAGVHIDETQQLTKELEEFLNSSKNGVVYFSMGSMVKSESFSKEKILAVYDSFAELSDYKVLWKGKMEELPTGLPPNVKMVPWIPQYATLRHPNVKAFVTHGGLMGTLEAIHAGVPMIGIPFFADQTFNIAGYAHRGFAIHLDYETLSKESFSEALRKVLKNPDYQSNVDRVSRLFKDRPLSPLAEAIYWIEYVIRNGGEPLKSSGRHLYWFQYYLIDVGLFLLAVATLVPLALFLFVKKLMTLFSGTRNNNVQIKKKTS
ncbi:UDP-glucosyltransferase 2-like [Neodiprion pinetum]|uniref:UDP-glucosyltransferase 2-like n=1 Tax=Neodiprion pinetum TaxID=441929 RepID=UPI001EDDE362|nr:UDP-glucosyltransferase 2-like [Neodiprion pinetum]XP_046482541.1 UDP-glucosyltransferase 2-like [Neodiprion pinetum]